MLGRSGELRESLSPHRRFSRAFSSNVSKWHLWGGVSCSHGGAYSASLQFTELTRELSLYSVSASKWHLP